MIEKIVLTYLLKALDVSVYMEHPEERPDTYVLIEKTGSRRVNYINHATFAIQSYALSMMEAAELNELVKAAMDELIVLPEISASSLNSDYNFTDTETKQYRYQAVYDLVF